MAQNKTKLTRGRIKRICDALAIGASYATAAQFAGISPKTLYNWRMQGELDEDGLCRDLVDAMLVAEGQAKVGALATIRKAISAGEWRASAWLLERREPDGYERKARLELSGSTSQRLTITEERASELVEQLSDETLAELADMAERIERENEEASEGLEEGEQ